MKVLVLLSLVAFCASVPTIGRRVIVEEDGAITLTAPRHLIKIFSGMSNPRQLNILVKSPVDLQKSFLLDEPLTMRTVDLRKLLETKDLKNLDEDYTQMDILDVIFRQHEGMLDDLTYSKILKKIELLVENGVLNKHVLTVLRYFEKYIQTEDLKESNNVMTKRMEPRVITKDVVMPLEDGVALMHEVSGVIPVERVERLPQYDNEQVGLRTVVPLQRDLSMRYMGVDKYMNMDQDLTTMTPFQRIQMLLQQNRQNRQYEQNTMGEQYYPQQRMLSQQYMTPMYLQRDQELQQELNYQPMMTQMNQQGLGQTQMSPLNRFLVNSRLSRGQQGMVMPQQWTLPQMQERMVNGMDQEHLMYQVPQHWTYQQVPQQMMDQRFMNKHMMDQDTMTQQMREQQMMNEKMMEQQMLKQKMMNQEMLKQKMMNQEMLKQKMMNQEMLNQKIMYPEMLSQRMMGQQMQSQNMMGQHMMNKEMMYQPQYMTRMWQVPMQMVY